MGQEAAKSMLKEHAPKNLLGVIAPASSQWFAVLEYSDIGYLKSADTARLDAADMLNALRRNLAGQGSQNPGMASTDWELKPSYDSDANRLEWAIKADDGRGLSVNYSVCLLGRRGVVQMIAVLPSGANVDLAPVRDVAKGIAFREGERYADYSAGDKLATQSLAGLVTGSSGSSRLAGIKNSLIENKRTVAAAGLAVACLGLGAIGVNKLRRDRARRASLSRGVAATLGNGNGQVVHAAANGNGAAPARNGGTQKFSKPVLAARNGQSFKHDGRKRKKHFRYHAFYSEMVMKLSSSNYGASTAPVVSGGEYYDSTGGQLSMSAARNGAAARSEQTRALAEETAKLIEGQQKLIEGYRNLIEEQNKLIEEKSRLLAAESRNLSKDTEVLEEQQVS